MNETRADAGRPRHGRLFTALVILALSLILFAHHARGINERIAYEGFGPRHYVHEKKHPETYEKDFIDGALDIYDNALPMRVYPFLDRYFGMDPSTVVYPYMFVQILLFLFSVAYLIQTLFKNTLFTMIALMATVASSLSGMNLSIFGTSFGALLGFPLFYGYANAFRLLGVAFFLKQKYIAASLMLALAVYCHVNMGLFAIVFVSGFLLIRPRILTDRRFLAGAGLLLLIVLPWLYSVLTYAELATDPMPVEAWIKSTRIFCHHWYPFTMKLFTDHAHHFFFPMLLIAMSGFIGLRHHMIGDESLQKILAGAGACIAIGIIGVIFSDIIPVTLIIKVSPQRATDLVTFFALLYTCYYLFRYMENDRFLPRLAAVYAMTVLFFSKPGFAVLPMMFLLFQDMRENRLGTMHLNTPARKRIALGMYTLTATFLIAITAINILVQHLQDGFFHQIMLNFQNHLWKPLKFFNPTFDGDFLIKGGKCTFLPCGWMAILAIIIAKPIGWKPENRQVSDFPWNAFAVVTAFFILFAWFHFRAISDRDATEMNIRSDYMAVQLWARDNTSPDALFMPDPSMSYGWRDFANRASFGNVREWGYVAIAYTPNRSRYIEGKNRLKIFGIDIDEITEKDIKNSHTRVLGDTLVLQAKARYYSASPEQLQSLCNAYGIDYFIMAKANLTDSRFNQMLGSFHVPFQNDSFIVFQRNTPEFLIARHERALESSFHPVLAYRLGLLYRQRGEREKALAMIEKAVDSAPDFVEALNALGVLFAEKGELRKAAGMYERIIAIRPDAPASYYNLACLAARRGMIADALMHLEQALRRGYDNYELIQSDPDLERVRETHEYKQLMSKHP